MCLAAHIHGAYSDARGQLVGDNSLLPSCGMWISERAYRLGDKNFFSTELSCWPLFITYHQFIAFDLKVFVDLFKIRNVNFIVQK